MERTVSLQPVGAFCMPLFSDLIVKMTLYYICLLNEACKLYFLGYTFMLICDDLPKGDYIFVLSTWFEY